MLAMVCKLVSLSFLVRFNFLERLYILELLFIEERLYILERLYFLERLYIMVKLNVMMRSYIFVSLNSIERVCPTYVLPMRFVFKAKNIRMIVIIVVSAVVTDSFDYDV